MVAGYRIIDKTIIIITTPYIIGVHFMDSHILRTSYYISRCASDCNNQPTHEMQFPTPLQCSDGNSTVGTISIDSQNRKWGTTIVETEMPPIATDVVDTSKHKPLYYLSYNYIHVVRVTLTSSKLCNYNDISV